jgi:hypothetical protein
MGRPLLLKVTAEHISRGVPGNRCKCPVALALKVLFPDATTVEVDSVRLVAAGDSGELLYRPTPALVRDFVNDFDMGHKVEPFEYPLSVPGETEGGGR